jgi:hypothetical protein
MFTNQVSGTFSTPNTWKIVGEWLGELPNQLEAKSPVK